MSSREDQIVVLNELLQHMDDVARSFAWVEDDRFVHHHARMRLEITASADRIRSKMLSLEEDVDAARQRGEI